MPFSFFGDDTSGFYDRAFQDIGGYQKTGFGPQTSFSQFGAADIAAGRQALMPAQQYAMMQARQAQSQGLAGVGAAAAAGGLNPAAAAALAGQQRRQGGIERTGIGIGFGQQAIGLGSQFATSRQGAEQLTAGERERQRQFLSGEERFASQHALQRAQGAEGIAASQAQRADPGFLKGFIAPVAGAAIGAWAGGGFQGLGGAWDKFSGMFGGGGDALGLGDGFDWHTASGRAFGESGVPWARQGMQGAASPQPWWQPKQPWEIF
jgi:hypothetical protein